MTHPRVTATSTLGLCPFFVRGRGDHYTVIDREGRRAISTGKAGVAAIRLLAAGRSVEQTKGVLARRFGHPASEIDLRPLLDTLLASGFVRTLDRHPITAGGEPARRSLRLWLMLLWSPLLELALRHLPPRLALPLAYRWFTRAPGSALERRIADNLRRAPGLGRSDGDIARIAVGACDALRKQYCDRLLLGSLSPRRLRRWLGQEVRVSGLEHVARAAAAGRGTILCAFHMGSYALIPFVLAARGVAVTTYAGFGGDARSDLATWLAERAGRGDAYPVRIIGGPMGLRDLTRHLEQGETVLLYCDRAPEEDAAPRDGRGLIAVPFLGTRIWAARGVAWLQLRTRASVLPAVLLWEGRRGHRLHIDQELTSERGTAAAKAIETVMAGVYGVLERHVRREPAQWLRWKDFGSLMAP